MTYDKHDESGKFTPTFSSDEFLHAIEELDVPTTADIAEAVGCAHRTALYHLNTLEDDGKVTSRKAGPAKIWQRAEDGETE